MVVFVGQEGFPIVEGQGGVTFAKNVPVPRGDVPKNVMVWVESGGQNGPVQFVTLCWVVFGRGMKENLSIKSPSFNSCCLY